MFRFYFIFCIFIGFNLYLLYCCALCVLWCLVILEDCCFVSISNCMQLKQNKYFFKNIKKDFKKNPHFEGKLGFVCVHIFQENPTESVFSSSATRGHVSYSQTIQVSSTNTSHNIGGCHKQPQARHFFGLMIHSCFSFQAWIAQQRPCHVLVHQNFNSLAWLAQLENILVMFEMQFSWAVNTGHDLRIHCCFLKFCWAQQVVSQLHLPKHFCTSIDKKYHLPIQSSSFEMWSFRSQLSIHLRSCVGDLELNSWAYCVFNSAFSLYLSADNHPPLSHKVYFWLNRFRIGEQYSVVLPNF